MRWIDSELERLNDEAPWHTSSYSAQQGECVEVAALRVGQLVRDSKNPNGAVLAVPSLQWLLFRDAAGAGQFHM